MFEKAQNCVTEHIMLNLNVDIKQRCPCLQTCLCLSTLGRAEPPVSEVWLFFNIIFKHMIKLEMVILHKRSMGSTKGNLMIVPNRDHKARLNFYCVCLFEDK